MNTINDRLKLTDCQQQIQESVEGFRKLVRDYEDSSDPVEREDQDASICLVSRSAYFEFCTWAIINDKIDEPSKRDLEEIFKQALAIMGENQYKNAVQERYADFRARCQSGVNEIKSPSVC